MTVIPVFQRRRGGTDTTLLADTIWLPDADSKGAAQHSSAQPTGFDFITASGAPGGALP